MSRAVIDHIDVDEKGVARRIVGSRSKVIHLVMEKNVNNWTPEEIQAQHPHLTLAQIHAAFAFYYDHQAELDATIQKSIEEYDRLWKEQGESPLIAKLRAMGKLP